jgi:hypothetical protein
MPAAIFVVRATVPDPARREAFDRWYRDVHLPDAIRSIGPRRAWRIWSLADPAMHQAIYQFDDVAAMERAVSYAADCGFQPRLAGRDAHAREFCARAERRGVSVAADG